MENPSHFLPSLQPLPAATSLIVLLGRLENLFAPTHVVVDLTTPSGGSEDDPDEYETAYTRSWLERVVSAASRRSALGETDWDAIVDRAAMLLAHMSGHCAAGERVRSYLLPRPRPLHAESSTALPPLSITLRDTTLLADSTGFRTWGSSTLLSQRLASDPSTSFSFETPNRPLRILELGSGTGLVGLTTAAIMRLLERPVHIDLSDFEDAVLDNLQHNIKLNADNLDSSTLSVRRLDWYNFVSGALPPAEEQSAAPDGYDYILAADVIYEPLHVEGVLSTVVHLLRLDEAATLHLVLPLRPTHADVHDAFDDAVSPSSEGCYTRQDLYGRQWRLVTRERTVATGEDGFGDGRVRVSDGKVTRYWVYRIGWARVQSSS